MEKSGQLRVIRSAPGCQASSQFVYVNQGKRSPNFKQLFTFVYMDEKNSNFVNTDYT